MIVSEMVYRIALKVLFICLLTLPVVAWADEVQDRLGTALQVIPGSEDTTSFTEGFMLLRESQYLDFLERFEELNPEDRAFAVAIYLGGLPDAEDDRSRARLLRGAIMIPDIRENVAFVVENGYVREDADGTRESTNILWFLEMVIEDYPTLQTSVLDLDFIRDTRQLYQNGEDVLRERLAEAQQELAEAQAELERSLETGRRLDALIAQMSSLVEPIQN